MPCCPLPARVAHVSLLLLALLCMTAMMSSAHAAITPTTLAMTTTSDPPSNTSYTACAEYKTCEDCLASSYTCHFCESDFQCHTIGSPSGCLVGISTCHHLEDCKRGEPQHVGYGPPPSVVIAVLCIMLTLTCCICGIASICSVFVGQSRRRRRHTAATTNNKKKQRKGTTMRSDVDEALAASQHEPLLAESDEQLLSFEANGDDAALERLRDRREREFTWKSFVLRLVGVSTLVGLAIAALMFYPRMPDYNVCNRAFDWESILHSMMSLQPKIEYQVLISAINENRFGFFLEEGRADIYHNNTLVGYWHLDAPLEAKAGAITDVIAPIKIEPGYKEAYSLWTDFSKDELVFRINATISGAITYGKHKIYRIETSVDDIEFLVGAEYDRGLCKCSEYLIPQ